MKQMFLLASLIVLSPSRAQAVADTEPDGQIVVGTDTQVLPYSKTPNMPQLYAEVDADAQSQCATGERAERIGDYAARSGSINFSFYKVIATASYECITE